MSRYSCPSVSLTTIVQEAGISAELIGASDVVITGITQDSRAVKQGDLFCCVRGQHAENRRVVAAPLLCLPSLSTGHARLYCSMESGKRKNWQMDCILAGGRNRLGNSSMPSNAGFVGVIGMPFSSKISNISDSLTSKGWLAIQSRSSDTLSLSSFARSLLDRRGDTGAFSGLSARGGLLERFGVAGSA